MAFGCLLCEKAGITNLAIDGFMTVGCFVSVACVRLFGGSVWLGMLGAIIGTALYSALFGLVVVQFKANNIIASIAMNLLSTGLTTFLMMAVFDTQGLFRLANFKKLAPFRLSFLDNVPVLNAFINNQSVVVLFTIVMIFVMRYIINRTEYGLKVTALGQSEGAALSAGISAARVRWSVILLSGAFCGLAGAYLSTSILSEFSEGMVAGRGFTAYTAVVFGASNPIGVALVTLLFGCADAVGIQVALAGTGIPSSIVSMLPYIVALITLIISSMISRLRENGKLLFSNN
jgi:simple sugar transport system permease protein